MKLGLVLGLVWVRLLTAFNSYYSGALKTAMVRPLPTLEGVSGSSCTASRYYRAMALPHRSTQISSTLFQSSLTHSNPSTAPFTGRFKIASALTYLRKLRPGQLIKPLLIVASVVFGLPFYRWKALAAVADNIVPTGGVVVKGWDIFGRVPNDDWLFSNQKLLDPDVLKPSFVEAVTREIPYALGHFRRRKTLHYGVMWAQGMVVASAALVLLGFLTVLARNEIRKTKER